MQVMVILVEQGTSYEQAPLSTAEVVWRSLMIRERACIEFEGRMQCPAGGGGVLCLLCVSGAYPALSVLPTLPVKEGSSFYLYCFEQLSSSLEERSALASPLLAADLTRDVCVKITFGDARLDCIHCCCIGERRPLL